MPEIKSTEWDSLVSQYPSVHLLQTSQWGRLKEQFGWDVVRVIAENPLEKSKSGAQIFFKKIPFGLTWAYIPKGPLQFGVSTEHAPEKPGYPWESLWSEIDSICRERKTVFLKVEADLWQDDSIKDVDKIPSGFRSNDHAIQPLRTLLVDLQADEEEILARMKQKTRYNIRLSKRRGVTVAASADLDTFSSLMDVTAQRDQFGVHDREYYQNIYEIFHARGECELFMAEFEDTPLAALLVFARGERAWYLYGASSDRYRKHMPTYLLQWEAMRWARSRGCKVYDLWGVPDEDEETLEANFTSRSEGLWGVYRFKRGFGGELCRAVGPWDRVYQPILYLFYRLYMKTRNV